MIEVTRGARRHLSDRLPDETDNVCFRISPTEDGNYTLRMTVPREDHVLVTHEGTPVLSFEPSLAERLDGWLLDVEVRPSGQRSLVLVPSPHPG